MAYLCVQSPQKQIAYRHICRTSENRITS